MENALSANDKAKFLSTNTVITNVVNKKFVNDFKQIIKTKGIRYSDLKIYFDGKIHVFSLNLNKLPKKSPMK